jgi:hypothetical protein
MGILTPSGGTIRVPRCDCKCATLGVSVLVSRRTGSASKSGAFCYGDEYNNSFDGVYYLTQTVSFSDGGSQVYTYDPTTGTISETGTLPFTGDETVTLSDVFTDDTLIALASNDDAAAAWSTFAAPSGPYIADYRSYGSTGSDQPGYVGPFVYALNGSPLTTLYFDSAKYKLHVDFTYPWISGSITFHWRERTANYTGSQTTTYSTGSDGSQVAMVSPPVEEGFIIYADFTEEIFPEPGAMFAETSEHSVLGSGLNLGDRVSIIGPDLPSAFSALGFAAITLAAAAQKYGAAPYIIDAATTAAVPRYLTETATSTPDSTVDYSGAVVNGPSGLWVNPYYPPPGPGYSSSTLVNVPPQYVSSFDDLEVYPYSPPQDTELDLQPAQATAISQASITWNNGLILTLTDELTTAAMQAPADAAVAAEIDPTPLATEPLFYGTRIQIAARNLSPSELTYLVQKSVYAPRIQANIDPGVPSQFGQPMLCPNSGTIDLQWTRSQLALDTGVWTDSTGTASLDYDASGLTGSPTSFTPPDPVSATTEPVPESNQVIYLHSLRISDDSIPALILAPTATITPAAA